MDTTERIAITQAWLRRHTPPREQPLLLAEAEEIAHWSDDELAQWRHDLIHDYTTAVEMRSSLFPNLVSFEAWYRLTGYVLGQPMAQETADRTAWLWDYSPDSYMPYNPWMVEEQAMIVTLAGDGRERFEADWAAQCERLREAVPHWSGTPTDEQPAFWQHLGTSPLFMRLVNTERW